MAALAEARILDSEGFYQRNTYQINDMPWPVTDRDLVLEIRISEQPKGRFTLAMINHPDALPLTDKVRITQSEGSTFTPVAGVKPISSGNSIRIRVDNYLPGWSTN